MARPFATASRGFTIAGISLPFSIAACIGNVWAIHPLMWAIASFLVAFFAADWLSANVF